MKKQERNYVTLDAHIGKWLRVVILLLASVFFSFTALTFFILFGLSDLFSTFILFMIIFPFFGLFFSMKGFRFISRKIENVTLKKKYKIKKIKRYVLYSAIPFAIAGIMSIILALFYKHLISIAKVGRFVYSAERQIESIHLISILITLVLVFVFSFAILVKLLVKNKCLPKDAKHISLYNASWLMVWSLAITFIIYSFSFAIFVFINMSGGVGFGP